MKTRRRAESVTLHEEHRRRVERRAEEARNLTLWIRGLSMAERDAVRARIGHSGVSDCGDGGEYVISDARYLPLAIVTLTALRGRRKVRVRVTNDGLELTAKAPVNERDL